MVDSKNWLESFCKISKEVSLNSKKIKEILDEEYDEKYSNI